MASDPRWPLDYRFAVHGESQHIRSGHGPERVVGKIPRWPGQAAVDTLYFPNGQFVEERLHDIVPLPAGGSTAESWRVPEFG